MKFLTGNPVMPFVAIAVAVFGVVSAFGYYGANNLGVEFFVKTEPERAVAYVRARGNLSLAERDRLLQDVENIVIDVDGVESVFAFAGDSTTTTVMVIWLNLCYLVIVKLICAV